MLSLFNRLKYFLVDSLGLHIYIYVINVLYKIQMAITYTGIYYNGYLWSSRLSSIPVCGPAMSSYTNSVWLKLIFSHAVHPHLREREVGDDRMLIWATPTAGLL